MNLETNLKARQIKAARALANWSQENLARASGLSITTIRKLELGNISPRGKTNDLIFRTFESAGIEFIEPDGVRHRPDNIQIYRGHEGIRAFFDEVYKTAASKGGEILQVLDDEDPFCEAMGEQDAVYMRNMEAVKDKFTFRSILTDNIKNLCGSAYIEYRALSKEYVNSVPFYIYDNKYAIIDFKTKPSPQITVLYSPSVANAFRRQFYSMWDKAMPLNETAIKSEKETGANET